VSKLVSVVLHVWMVAVPVTAGVHRNTDSGDVPVVAQVPASALAPAVAPVNVPPWGGITNGAAHVPVGSVVLVVLEVLVVVVGGCGALTCRLKVPAAPPKPSTTRKYV
jgi:hypothetical protein